MVVAAAQTRDPVLLLARSQELDTPQHVRPRGRHRRQWEMPGPVSPGRQRQPARHQMGDGGQRQPGPTPAAREPSTSSARSTARRSPPMSPPPTPRPSGRCTTGFEGGTYGTVGPQPAPRSAPAPATGTLPGSADRLRLRRQRLRRQLQRAVTPQPEHSPRRRSPSASPTSISWSAAATIRHVPGGVYDGPAPAGTVFDNFAGRAGELAGPRPATSRTRARPRRL